VKHLPPPFHFLGDGAEDRGLDDGLLAVIGSIEPELGTGSPADRVCRRHRADSVKIYTRSMGEQYIFRVTVRGRFAEMSESQRISLIAALDDHHVTGAAYTGEGTLTYDARLDSFSLRYEIRTAAEHPEEASAELGMHEAERFLRTLGIGYRDLKVTTTDMRAMWDGAAPRQAR
jgi:hypothetical protein